MFDFRKTIEKTLRGFIAGGVSVASTFLAKHVGLELTPDQQTALIVFVFGVISGLSNFLKHKFPKYFGWF